MKITILILLFPLLSFAQFDGVKFERLSKNEFFAVMSVDKKEIYQNGDELLFEISSLSDKMDGELFSVVTDSTRTIAVFVPMFDFSKDRKFKEYKTPEKISSTPWLFAISRDRREFLYQNVSR